LAIPNTKISFNIFSKRTCKAANNLYIAFSIFAEKNISGLDDCAGVANSTLTVSSDNDGVMPQEVNYKFFGKHVMLREFVRIMVDIIKDFRNGFEEIETNNNYSYSIYDTKIFTDIILNKGCSNVLNFLNFCEW